MQTVVDPQMCGIAGFGNAQLYLPAAGGLRGGYDPESLARLAQLARSEAVVVGADIVEINPERDINGLTAMVGAKLVMELLELVGVSSP